MLNFTAQGLLSANRVVSLFHLVSQVLHCRVPGDIVEFGCFQGHSAAFIQETLDLHGSNKRLILYDSFQGLPEVTDQDGTFLKAGDLASRCEDVATLFHTRQLRQPAIVAGYFEELQPDQLPEFISFVHFDGDFYTSARAVLPLVWPNLSVGGVVLLDDCGDPHFPGVRSAFDEFNQSGPGLQLIELGTAEPFTRSAYFVKG